MAKKRRPGELLDLFLDRGLPLLLGLTTLLVVLGSDTDPNLIIVSGRAAEGVLLGYLGVLGFLAIKPNAWWAHRIGLAVGLIAWGGRATSFVELAVDTDRTLFFVANAAERFAIAVLIVVWHLTQSYRMVNGSNMSPDVQ